MKKRRVPTGRHGPSSGTSSRTASGQVTGRDPRPASDPFIYRYDPADLPRPALDMALSRFRRRTRLVPLEGAQEPMCDFGDSGSVWYDPETGEAVALHCTGGSAPTPANASSIATSLIYATQRLGARLPA